MFKVPAKLYIAPDVAFMTFTAPVLIELNTNKLL